MDEEMKEAIRNCVKVIRKKGWKEAESFIEAGVKKFGEDFRKWCGAIMSFKKKRIELN